MKHVVAAILLCLLCALIPAARSAPATPTVPRAVASPPPSATTVPEKDRDDDEGVWIVELLKEHWFATLSFVLAAAGGVPGILGIWDRRKNKARFHYSLNHTFSATRVGDNRLVVLLTGTVSNDGKSPLTPASYELQCKIGRGKWVRFDKELVLDDMRLQEGFQIASARPLSHSDIHRFSGSISEGQPIHGHLLFSTPKMTSEEFQLASDNRTLKMRMVCVDVLNRRHVSEIELTKEREDVEGAMSYPQQGVTFIRTRSEGTEPPPAGERDAPPGGP